MRKTKVGKGARLMVLANSAGILLGVNGEKASPPEVKMLEPTLASRRVGVDRKPDKPPRGIGDRGYDSNRVRPLTVKR